MYEFAEASLFLLLLFIAVSRFRFRESSSVKVFGGVSKQCMRGTIYCVRRLV